MHTQRFTLPQSPSSINTCSRLLFTADTFLLCLGKGTSCNSGSQVSLVLGYGSFLVLNVVLLFISNLVRCSFCSSADRAHCMPACVISAASSLCCTGTLRWLLSCQQKVCARWCFRSALWSKSPLICFTLHSSLGIRKLDETKSEVVLQVHA